ncbi:MAG TPA: tRNA (adenosine(37)-N6)-threonylcarbamoyltransferase complex dimerization subunit type 1 TsaB [Pyrinomonadaceae bacterium]|nr:tRNA (adenosine(37)-N6)-threonylcarbamoyltransferase complex dimerization subunit type 1 TsaB [Pyrinomonadaceae bacterium]
MSNDISVNEAGTAGAGGRAPLTLALDTATPDRSAALVRGARVLAARTRVRGEAGASTVLLDVDEVLREAGARLEDVELFAAATGPGSFTGIRAGLATLMALARAKKRQAVGVPTLEALAHAARPAERLYAVLPAGRGELFAQLLSAPVEGGVEPLGPAGHVAPAELLRRAEALGGGLKWACGCAPEFAAQLLPAARAAGLEARAAEGAAVEAGAGEWLVVEACGGLAVAVAALAVERVNAVGAAGAAETLRPLYVRPSDAELKG